MSTTPAYSSRTVRLPGLGREVEDILLWRDVKVSAGAFVGATLLYLLLEWSGYSLLTLISNTLLALVSAAFIWNNVAKFTGKSGVPLPRVVKEGVSEGQLRSFAQTFTTVVNKGLSFTNRLTSGEDVVLTVEVAVGLYVFGKIGNYFSSLGLLYTLVVLAFTLPKVYELKKDDIDQAVSTASQQGKVHYNKYVEPYMKRIPKASTSSSATTSNIGGPASNRPSALESDADSFTNVTKEGIPPFAREGGPQGGLQGGLQGGQGTIPSDGFPLQGKKLS